LQGQGHQVHQRDPASQGRQGRRQVGHKERDMSDSITKRNKAKQARRNRAHLRLRKRVRGSAERPRLSVYKSLRFIYAQVIDDDKGVTLAQANSSDSSVREQVGVSTGSKAAAKLVGEL